jgi:hypothetical protein
MAATEVQPQFLPPRAVVAVNDGFAAAGGYKGAAQALQVQLQVRTNCELQRPCRSPVRPEAHPRHQTRGHVLDERLDPKVLTGLCALDRYKRLALGRRKLSVRQFEGAGSKAVAMQVADSFVLTERSQFIFGLDQPCLHSTESQTLACGFDKTNPI